MRHPNVYPSRVIYVCTSSLFFLNFAVHFFPMYGNGPRCIYPDFNLIAAYFDHGNLNVIADDDALIPLTREHEQFNGPSLEQPYRLLGACTPINIVAIVITVTSLSSRQLLQTILLCHR